MDAVTLPRRYVPNHNWGDYSEQEIADACTVISQLSKQPKTPEKYDQQAVNVLRLMRDMKRWESSPR